MQIRNLVNVYVPTAVAVRPSARVAPGVAVKPSVGVTLGAAKSTFGETPSFEASGLGAGGLQEQQHRAQVGVGAFVTKQSLMAFPVASAAVVIIWKVLGAVFPEWGASKIVPLIAAFMLGILIYVISEKGEVTLRDRIVGLAIAVVNSFWLAASAMGIDHIT